MISSIKSSTQTQEEKIKSLESLNENINEYISDVVTIDQNAAAAINKSKNDFYDKYEYLKPDIEKSWLEEKWDNACEWCKENWQPIVSLVLTIVVVGIVILSIATFGTAIPVIAAGIVGAIVGVSSQLSRGGNINFFGENLENITGGQKRSSFEILFDTGLSTGTAAFFSAALSKISGKLSKTLSEPVFTS